jgi:hypothetical protein
MAARPSQSRVELCPSCAQAAIVTVCNHCQARVTRQSTSEEKSQCLGEAAEDENRNSRRLPKRRSIVERLRPFDIICVMREDMPLSREIIEQLSELKLIASRGSIIPSPGQVLT